MCIRDSTSDVGGCVPSSITPTATDIQMEGLRIPPVKLFQAGKENQDIKALFLANSRMPVLNMGDLNAMVSAVNTAERKIHEIVAKFGLQTAKDSMLDLIDVYKRQVCGRIFRTGESDKSRTGSKGQ